MPNRGCTSRAEVSERARLSSRWIDHPYERLSPRQPSNGRQLSATARGGVPQEQAGSRAAGSGPRTETGRTLLGSETADTEAKQRNAGKPGRYCSRQCVNTDGGYRQRGTTPSFIISSYPARARALQGPHHDHSAKPREVASGSGPPATRRTKRRSGSDFRTCPRSLAECSREAEARESGSSTCGDGCGRGRWPVHPRRSASCSLGARRRPLCVYRT